jgi:hypothetical protein
MEPTAQQIHDAERYALVKQASRNYYYAHKQEISLRRKQKRDQQKQAQNGTGLNIVSLDKQDAQPI